MALLDWLLPKCLPIMCQVPICPGRSDLCCMSYPIFLETNNLKKMFYRKILKTGESRNT